MQSSTASSSSSSSTSEARAGSGTEHCLGCVVLAVSKELVNCGLFSMVQALAVSADHSFAGPQIAGQQEGMSFRGKMHLSSLEMYSLVYKILSAKYSDVYSSILSMGRRFEGLQLPDSPPNPTTAGESDAFPVNCIDFMFRNNLCGPFFECSPTGVVNCPCEFCDRTDISNDSAIGGRCLRAIKPVTRGQTLLKESPLASVLASSCNCGADSLLVEHVLLAWSMSSYSSSDDFIGSTDLLHSETDEEFDSTFLKLGVRRSREDMLKHIMKNFTSGLSDNVLRGSDEVTTLDKRVSVDTWPLKKQVLMAAICVNCELFSKYHRKAYEMTAAMANISISSVNNADLPMTSPPITITDSSEMSLSTAASKSPLCNGLTMFMLLARLPTNTLAISKVITINSDSSVNGVGKSNSYRNDNSSGEINNRTHNLVIEEIAQVRLGYGVFRMASAVNHSCKPNALIKFNIPVALRDTIFNRYAPTQPPMTPLKHLRETYVEIVSLGDNIGSSGDLSKKESCSCRPDCYRAFIDPGEIRVSYGPLHTRMARDGRRAALADQYLFYCRCEACSPCYTTSSNSTTIASAAISSTTSSNSAARPTTSTATSTEQSSVQSDVTTKVFQTNQSGERSAISVAALTEQLCLSIQTVSIELRTAMSAFDKLMSVNSQLSRVPNQVEMKLLQDFDREKLARVQTLCSSVLLRFLTKEFSHGGIDVEEFVRHAERSQLEVASSASITTSYEYIMENLLKLLIRTTSVSIKSDKTKINAGIIGTHSNANYRGNELIREFGSNFATILDLRGRLLAKCDNFNKAAIAVASSILVLLQMFVYTATDIEIARELVKLSQLLSMANLRSSHHRRYLTVCLRLASDSLVELVGTDDPDFVEVRCMMRFLTGSQ